MYKDIKIKLFLQLDHFGNFLFDQRMYKLMICSVLSIPLLHKFVQRLVHTYKELIKGVFQPVIKPL